MKITIDIEPQELNGWSTLNPQKALDLVRSYVAAMFFAPVTTEVPEKK